MSATVESRVRHNGNKTNICFDCQKACGGCSWSAIDPKTDRPRFEPVPGWTAKKVKLLTGHSHERAVVIDTYHITACPDFVKDAERKTARVLGLSLEQVDILLKHWIERGEM